MKRLALLLALVLCLLSPLTAAAEVRRGDHGEEVRYLQWLLQQTGYLSDNPDGSFGPRTEQAVMDYQKSKGYEETGVADEALMLEIDGDRVRLDKEAHGQDYYQPYPGSYEPAQVADYTSPSHCQTTVLRDIAYRDSCSRHLALLEQEYSLTAQGGADGFAEASQLWLKEIEALYAEWADGMPAGQRQAVQDAWSAWDTCFQAQYGALNAAWNDPVISEKQLLIMLKNYTGTVCEFLSGDMPATPGEDYLPLSGGASTEPFCVQWSINAGTEFITGCATHAPLFDREYAWTGDGAEDAATLASISADWDAALSALYDQWAASCADDAAEGVRLAQSAFDEALSHQDAALSQSGLAPLARVRVTQLEAARLCELLNHI